MEQWQEDIKQWVENGTMRQATFSQLRRKEDDIPAKTVIRPIELKGKKHIQFEYHFQTKVTHENVPQAEASSRIIAWLEQNYRQALLSRQSKLTPSCCSPRKAKQRC